MDSRRRQRTAAARIAGDQRQSWSTACAAGLEPAVTAPHQLDALHAAALEVHAGLDGDTTSSLAIDRMGLEAVRGPVVDAWARCGGGARRSPTEPLDGTYSSPAPAVLARFGTVGTFRLQIARGRYAIVNPEAPADPEWPGWDFARDPVEVGSIVLDGDVATLRTETTLRLGATAVTARFERFRDRLRWDFISGDDGLFRLRTPWRSVD